MSLFSFVFSGKPVPTFPGRTPAPLMPYSTTDLPLETLLAPLARAEDKLARLDEAIRLDAVGEGFIARAHFREAAAALRVAGTLVDLEDLVLHDAAMDVRAPTHELTVAHAILRARRRIAESEPEWALSPAGLAALGGIARDDLGDFDIAAGSETADLADAYDEEMDGRDHRDEVDDFADIDAILSRSRQILDGLQAGDGLAVTSRDAVSDERTRLAEWQSVERRVADLPPTLAASLLFDAWEQLRLMPHAPWLGGLVAGAYLRLRGKALSHLPALYVGLRQVPPEKRRHRNRTVRLLGLLQAIEAAADLGSKEIARLTQSRAQFDRRLQGRRSSSSLPAVADLVLSRPIVSAAMIARAANVTPRAALALVADLGVREVTGRGRYRAWGIL
jgi:hypothetical protein